MPKRETIRTEMKITIIIPALNEEKAIGQVIQRLPDYVDEIIIVDNGSTDQTSQIARKAGAKTLYLAKAGYGRACLAGVAGAGACNILVFLDADGADFPEQMDRLLRPIIEEEADMVIGSRTLGQVEAGALTLPQRVGNRLACALIGLFWGYAYTDLGPFRAIRKTAYDRLNMSAKTYGWTVQMQVRALAKGLRVAEAPVDYARRIGVSKISGTVKGVILAGTYIIATIFIECVRDRFAVLSMPAKDQKR